MNTSVQANWKNVAHSSYELGDAPSRELDHILPHLENIQVTNILDAGCWEGRNSFYFLENNISPFGVDISEMALLKCMGNMMERELYFPIVLQTTPNLPFFDESFDAVLSWRVLHNILNSEEREHLISELWRIVRPGGIAIISVRSANTIAHTYPRERIFKSPTGYHRLYYTPKDIQDEFNLPGQRVLDFFEFSESEWLGGQEFSTKYWCIVLQKTVG